MEQRKPLKNLDKMGKKHSKKPIIFTRSLWNGLYG